MDYSFTTIGALIGMAAAIIRNKTEKTGQSEAYGVVAPEGFVVYNCVQ